MTGHEDGTDMKEKKERYVGPMKRKPNERGQTGEPNLKNLPKPSLFVTAQVEGRQSRRQLAPFTLVGIGYSPTSFSSKPFA